METLELSDFVGGNVKWYKHFVERSDKFLLQLNIYLPYKQKFQA